MSVEGLAQKPVFDYDARLLIEAVDEAYQRWKQNDFYANRVQRTDAPERIRSISDIYQLPVIDMREFKQHPDELWVDPERVSEDRAIFSSGTTEGSQSFAARSEASWSRQRRLLERFARTCLPDIDRALCIAPGPAVTDQLPLRQGNRALFKYVHWFFEQFDSRYFINLDQSGEPAPDFEAVIDALETADGTTLLFGSTAYIDEFRRELADRGIRFDLGPEGIVLTGGGWKGVEATSSEAFRSSLTDRFGIRADHHLDWYGCTELFYFFGNRVGDPNPDRKRICSQGFAYVADADHFRRTGEVTPADGDRGLLVGVDPINTEYPGVILSDDVVTKTGGRYGPDVRIEYNQRATR